MATRNMFLGFLVVLATTEVVQGHDVQVLYHESVNFTCHPGQDAAISSSQITYRLWILPNGDLLGPDTTGHARVDVLGNGTLLHVKNVDDVDFGLYDCVMEVNKAPRTFLLSRHGLNVNGAYFGDLMELKYRNMIITGLIAGAVCFVTMGFVCFMYNKHQAREDKQAEDEKAAAMNELINRGIAEKTDSQKPMTEYTNVAYVPDGEEVKAKPPAKTSMTQHAEVADAGKKEQAPQPPAVSTQQQELRNMAAAGGADLSVVKTKL